MNAQTLAAIFVVFLIILGEAGAQLPQPPVIQPLVQMFEPIQVTPSPPFDYDDPFVNPYTIDNTFHVDCGNESDRRMKILFRGDAYKVFSALNTACVAVETEPGHFELDVKMSYPDCMPVLDKTLEIISLEVVIQKGLVRQYDDPTHIVTCNYEMGGAKTSVSKKTDDTEIDREAVFQQANLAKNSSAPLTMVLRDAQGQLVNTVYVGSYIQLEIEMTSVEGEVSFRPWNCKVCDNLNHHLVHWFVLRGCGDGDVIHRDRGFYTKALERDVNNTVTKSRSRSVFFRAFSFDNRPGVKFECTFIISSEESALGASCYKSPRFAKGRKRRDVKDTDIQAEETALSEAELLPSVMSREIRIIPRPAGNQMIRNPMLMSDNDVPKVPRPPSAFSRTKISGVKAPAYMTLKEAMRVARMFKHPSDITGEPVVVGLIVGICLAFVLLIAMSSLTVYLCCRFVRRYKNLDQTEL